MNALFFALNETKYMRVSRCCTAQDIWQLLEVTLEGILQVKESKINLLTCKYETFKIKDGESINAIYNRFNDIIVRLQNLGKKLELVELNRKLLASLPIECRPKVMVIEEAKNLKTITVEEHPRPIITYEGTFLDRSDSERYLRRVL